MDAKVDMLKNSRFFSNEPITSQTYLSFEDLVQNHNEIIELIGSYIEERNFNQFSSEHIHFYNKKVKDLKNEHKFDISNNALLFNTTMNFLKELIDTLNVYELTQLKIILERKINVTHTKNSLYKEFLIQSFSYVCAKSNQIRNKLSDEKFEKSLRQSKKSNIVAWVLASSSILISIISIILQYTVK